MFRNAGGVLSETLFSALVLVLVVAIERSEARRWWFGALATVIALLTVRYVGLAFAVVPAAWLAVHWRSLDSRERIVRLASLIGTGALLAGLLWTNFRVTGHLTGIPREPDGGSVVHHIGHYGWSVLGLVHSNPRALAERVPLAPLLGGLGQVLVLSAICGRALMRDGTRRARWSVLVIATYSVALVAARSTGRFDDLSVGRFFLPVLMPLCALLAERPGPRWLERGVCVALVPLAIATAARAPSAEVTGRVDAAVAFLRPRVTPSTVVVVNDGAISLAAQLDADATWVREPTATLPPASYLVIAARSADRLGSRYAYDPSWLERIRALEDEGWTAVLETEHVSILQNSSSRK